MRRSSLLAFTLLLLAPPTAGFGYVTGATTATTGSGTVPAFTVYVFGESGSVSLTGTEAPQGWTVAVDPRSINLPVTDPDRVLQTDGGYRNLRAVTVTATPSREPDPGIHTVTATFAQHAGNGTGTLRIQQEHPFRFTITVPPGEQSTTPGVSTQDSGNETENTTGTAEAGAMPAAVNGQNASNAGKSVQENALPVGLIVAFVVFELLWVVAMWRILR